MGVLLETPLVLTQVLVNLLNEPDACFTSEPALLKASEFPLFILVVCIFYNIRSLIVLPGRN